MRERAIEQFESVFEQAYVPVLDIREIELRRITLVVKGTVLDKSVAALAGYLKGRFGASVRVHWPARADRGRVGALCSDHGFEVAPEPFESTAALVGQVALTRSQLVILPEPAEEDARVLDVDALVSGTRPPVCFVRQPIDDPRAVLTNILHSVSGNFRQTQNFAYSFTLVEDDGRLLLLHVIDRDDLADVRQALRSTAELARPDEREILENLARSGERYLKGVVAASREKPYDVSYQLRIGSIVPVVRRELQQGGYGLLVVGQHKEGYSHITAEDYQLMRTVRDVPVLAL